MKTQYKLVLFDLDGTLIDTDKLIFMGYYHLFKKYRPDYEVTFKDMIGFLGPTLIDMFNIYFKNENKQMLIEEYREYVMSHHHKFVSVFNGAKELLEELNKLGVHIGVVTSKRKDVALHGLKQFGLDEYCELLIDCDAVKKFKPDPEGINYSMNHFNVKPEETLMVGDSQSDILAGINAKCHTVAVNYSIKGEFYKDLNVDYVVEKLLDILNIVKGE